LVKKLKQLYNSFSWLNRKKCCPRRAGASGAIALNREPLE
jgi:hypothetical protein